MLKQKPLPIFYWSIEKTIFVWYNTLKKACEDKYGYRTDQKRAEV